MTDENVFDEIVSENLSEEKEKLASNESSDYRIEDRFLKRGYDYDSSGLYKRYDFKYDEGHKERDERDIYLKMSRNPNKAHEMIYAWTSKEDGSYRILKSFSRDVLITHEEVNYNEKEDKMTAKFNKTLSSNGIAVGLNRTKDSFREFFFKILSDLSDSSCLDVFKELDYEFQEIDDESEELEDMESIEDIIEERRNPSLSEEEIDIAIDVESKIKNMGLIPYYDSMIDSFHIGNHKNIYRKHLGAVNVMRGIGRYIFGTKAKSEAGKSIEDEISFLILIPKEYIFKKNQMSLASFSRYGEVSPYYFDRLIIYFGDLGGKKSFEKLEDVFDMAKTLITEKEFSRDISEGKGKFENVTLELMVNSFGAVYQTVRYDFFGQDGGQLESRSIESTPFEANLNDILDLLFGLNMEDSIENQAQAEAKAEAEKFHLYLKYIVKKDIKIVNPYRSLFKRLVKYSEAIKRDFKQLLELFDSYCALTYFNCKVIDGRYIASQSQVKEFINEICLDNTLAPLENEFIKMLEGIKSDGEKNVHALTIIPISDDEDENDELNPLTPYMNSVLEAIEVIDDKNQSSLNSLNIEGLEYPKKKNAISKLLEMYRLGGTAMSHEENVFFRVSDIKRVYSRRNAFKNIDEVGVLLDKLYKKGFIGKLDFKDDERQNIYYLTSKCEDINEPMKLTEDDIIDSNNFLIEQEIDMSQNENADKR